MRHLPKTGLTKPLLAVSGLCVRRLLTVRWLLVLRLTLRIRWSGAWLTVGWGLAKVWWRLIAHGLLRLLAAVRVLGRLREGQGGLL